MTGFITLKRLAATAMFLALFAACIGKPVTQERVLPLQGAYNVRDMGGYRAAGGKTVKWRTIIRSGDLNHLTDTDLEYLATIPLKTTIDFRDSTEISAAPDRKPTSLTNQIFLPINTGSIVNFQTITAQQIPTLLVEGNKHFVRNNQEQYREFFTILMNKQNTPLLFHCSAGKDRAGFGAALFLSSLGVDRATIIEDYLLTNSCLKDKYASMIAEHPEMKPLMEARKEYIEAAFEVIDNEFGGMDNYLVNYLNVDTTLMRRLYTE